MAGVHQALCKTLRVKMNKIMFFSRSYKSPWDGSLLRRELTLGREGDMLLG